MSCLGRREPRLKIFQLNNTELPEEGIVNISACVLHRQFIDLISPKNLLHHGRVQPTQIVDKGRASPGQCEDDGHPTNIYYNSLGGMICH
jgi:hypothetical protein